MVGEPEADLRRARNRAVEHGEGESGGGTHH
jgi:hypothetical protein